MKQPLSLGRVFTGFTSIAVFLFCGGVILTWLLRPELKELLSLSMKMNTALGLAMGSLSLFYLKKNPTEITPRQKKLGIVLAGAWLLLSSLTSLEFLTGWDLRFDELLTTDFPTPESILHPGRMSPITLVCFILTSLSLLTINREGTKNPGERDPLRLESIHPMSVLLVPVLLMSLLAMVGYVYGVSYFYRIGPFVRIGWPTLICTFLLAFGILLARPECGMIRFFLSASSGGVTARRILPVAIFLPMVFGWTRLHLQQAGYIDTQGGTALFVVITMTVLCFIVGLNSRQLEKADLERAMLFEREQEALRGSQALLEKMVEEKTRILAEQQKMLVQSAKMAALGEMAGGIAHEINTPLSTIILKAHELNSVAQKNPELAPAILPITQKIGNTAQRIGEIITGLKSFAREAPADPFETVTLKSIIQDALNLCEARFKNHDIDIGVEPFPEHLSLECRPVQIVQVLLNLLNNSFDAVTGLQNKWIRIRTINHEKSVRLKVIDSGRGVPQELQSKLMQPFFTTKEYGRGTGLGLSISKGIIESHHGALIFDVMEPNTCFTAELPKVQSNLGGSLI